jgi:hypothetical protein
MTEIEDKILKEYPQLVKTLKCESNRTTCSTDHITVVFKHVPDTPDITAHKAQRKALQEQMINKKLELEQWEIECLQSALTDEGYPEFEITE